MLSADLLSYNEIQESMTNHDDRVKEGKSEIRMLTSMDDENTGGFVFFIVLRKDKVYATFTQDQEERAIRSYMEGR